jgi:hypothetical protein
MLKDKDKDKPKNRKANGIILKQKQYDWLMRLLIKTGTSY